MSSDEETGGGIDLDADGSRIAKRHLDDAAEYEGEEEEQQVVKQQQDVEVCLLSCLSAYLPFPFLLFNLGSKIAAVYYIISW